MKSKTIVSSKSVMFEKVGPRARPKSLRPMRSLMAIRSFRPKTKVASLLEKPEETIGETLRENE